jgi:tRNA-dihydrouridine synthase
VLGNGDIASAADAQRLMSQTGCDGVMIGRAAMGNPWIFLPQPPHALGPSQVIPVILEHLTRMLAHYGQERGLVLFRKHLARYLEHFATGETARRVVLTAPTAAELRRLLQTWAAPHGPSPAFPAAGAAASDA